MVEAKGVHPTYNVQGPADGHGKDEGSLWEHVTSSDAVDSNRHAVSKVEPHHRCGDDSVESAVLG